MTLTFDEGALRLEIEGTRGLKWDDDPAFVLGVRQLQGTKAVDVVADVDGEGGVYIELKDFRGHRIENADRIRSLDLAQEVAEKVRDTLAGLVWACERGLSIPDFERLVDPFVNDRDRKPLVVLWIEEDRADVAAASVLATEVRKRLKPHLNARVIVTSTHIERVSKHALQWLRVRGLPGN
ncbi:MAG: hypothetical protein H6719_29835 [Sandaracinaceae bacterium]|nr:hypothetical protein [Sandaracinaceae bacterium]